MFGLLKLMCCLVLSVGRGKLNVLCLPAPQLPSSCISSLFCILTPYKVKDLQKSIEFAKTLLRLPFSFVNGYLHCAKAF